MLINYETQEHFTMMLVFHLKSFQKHILWYCWAATAKAYDPEVATILFLYCQAGKKKASADHLWNTTLFVVYFSPTMLSETYFSVLFGCKMILIVSSRLSDGFLCQYRRRVKTKHRSTRSTSPISRSIYQSRAAQCILVVFSTFWTKGNAIALFFCVLL